MTHDPHYRASLVTLESPLRYVSRSKIYGSPIQPNDRRPIPAEKNDDPFPRRQLWYSPSQEELKKTSLSSLRRCWVCTPVMPCRGRNLNPRLTPEENFAGEQDVLVADGELWGLRNLDGRLPGGAGTRSIQATPALLPDQTHVIVLGPTQTVGCDLRRDFFRRCRATFRRNFRESSCFIFFGQNRWLIYRLRCCFQFVWNQIIGSRRQPTVANFPPLFSRKFYRKTSGFQYRTLNNSRLCVGGHLSPDSRC